MKQFDSRRIWALIIAIVMVLSLAPVAATADAADDGTTPASAARITFAVRPDDRTGISWNPAPGAWTKTEEVAVTDGTYDLSAYAFSAVFGVAVPDGYDFLGWSESSSTSDTTAIGTAEAGLQPAERTVYAILIAQKTEIRIVANSSRTDYNGTEQTVTGFKELRVGAQSFPTAGDALQFTLQGQTYSIEGVSAAGSGTDAGTYAVEITGEARVTNAGRDVTGEFRIVTVSGTLAIDPLDVAVTITGHRETLVYDGDEHLVTGYDVEIDTPLYRETDFTFDGTAAVIGRGAREFPMGLAPEQFTNTNPNCNVTFTVVDGGLTITKRHVTLRSACASKAYDGTPLQNGQFTILGDGFANDEMPIILVTGTVRTVGKVKNTILVSFGNAPKGLFDHSARPENYEITLDEGILEITPKTVVVTVKDQEKKYGAKDPAFTADVTGLLDGDTVQYTITREKGEATGDYRVTPTGDRLQGNYEVVFRSGTLHIGKQPKKPNGRFTLAWFSDARIGAQGARADALEAMVDWTVKNAAAKNIVGLFGTGSLVGTFRDAATETRAAAILSKIRAARVSDLRYYGVAGSIDVNGDEMNFAPSANRGVRGASIRYRDGGIWVQQLFDTGVTAVGIGYHKLAETEAEQNAQQRWIGYVNDRIAKMSSGRSCTILFVNEYVDETGALTPFGELIESEIVAKNPSVRMVLSSCARGTVHTEAVYGERTVNVLAFNYGEDETNGLGYLRLLTFDPKTRCVEVSTYSPVSDTSVYDAAAPEADTFTMENAY